MKIEDKLEIVIPTFNRCEKLGITFSYLLGENSPVKNCDITILDNCSTDDTPNLVKKIAEKNPNVRYRRNARNIGAWENDSRGHEITSKEYLWSLGDNDTYDWTYWKQVEEAIENGVDVIVVGYGICSQKPKDLRTWVLLPGGVDVYPLLIWKSANISDETLLLARFYECYNFDTCLGIILVNQKPDLQVVAVEGDIVVWVRLHDKRSETADRILSSFPSQESQLVFLCICNDRKLRNEAIGFFVNGKFFSPLCFAANLYLSFTNDPITHGVAWHVLLVLPWRWKLYLLAVGHWKLFKRILQKLIHLDFSIKSLNR
jgi:glycosyltransferase involved in cell wall biosynthesis